MISKVIDYLLSAVIASVIIVWFIMIYTAFLCAKDQIKTKNN